MRPESGENCVWTMFFLGGLVSIALLICSLITHIFYIGIFLYALVGLLFSGVCFYLIATTSRNTLANYYLNKDLDDSDRKIADRLTARQAKVIRVLFYIYFGFLVFELTIRILSLSVRSPWRNDLDGTFPTACGAWAANAGCTRVSLYAD